jgi:hypothetical protein
MTFTFETRLQLLGIRPGVISAGTAVFPLATLAVNSMPLIRKCMQWFRKVTHFSCLLMFITRDAVYESVIFVSRYKIDFQC